MKVYDRAAETVDLIVKKYWPQIWAQLKRVAPRRLAKKGGYSDEQFDEFKSTVKKIYDQLIASVFHPLENWQNTRDYLTGLQPKRVATKMGLKEEQYEKIVEVMAHPQKHLPETANNIINFKPRNWRANEGDDKTDFEYFVQGVIEPVKQKAVSIRHYKLPVDVVNFPEKYILTADLPGYSKDDIDISGEGHFITIAVQTSGLDETANNEDSGEYIMHERKHGTYTRIIELPRPIDINSIKGSYLDGVIKIEAAKQQVESHETVHISL